MEDLYLLLSKGGIIIIGEHLVGGETEAIKEFSKKHKSPFNYFSSNPGPSYYNKNNR